MITRTRTNLLKKLSAVVAVVLMLHTQAAWACANLSSDHVAPAPCCTEEQSAATSDRTPECDDLSSNALCAKPFAHGASQVLSKAQNDAQENDIDATDSSDGNGIAILMFTSVTTVVARLDQSPRVADPYETLAYGRLTYLKTLRLRI